MTEEVSRLCPREWLREGQRGLQKEQHGAHTLAERGLFLQTGGKLLERVQRREVERERC